MGSHLMVGKILLCFLLPAILSLDASVHGGTESSISWLRYWVVLGLGLVLELLLDTLLPSLGGVIVRGVKVVLVVWCLAPLEYNGSDMIVTYVLQPIHTGVLYVGVETHNVVTPLLHTMRDTVLLPSMEILGTAISTVFTFFAHAFHFIGDITQVWFQKMLPPINCGIAIIQHIAMKVVESALLGLEKFVELVGKTPELAKDCFYSSLDFAIFLANGSYDLSVTGANNIAEFSILATQKVIELSVSAFEKVTELATLAGHTVLSSIEDGVSYYRKNQENPRLFSQVLKQIIYQ